VPGRDSRGRSAAEDDVKYLLLIHWDERLAKGLGPADEEAMIEAHGAFRAALGARLLDAARLRPTAEGRRVTMRDGKRAVTDGPFTETKEVVGGYYLIECAGPDEAADWAARCPSARHGTVEARPVWPTP
jgi:hypothetical protein